MAASYPRRQAAAMPIDTEASSPDKGVHERTYQYLEDVWNKALQRAEAALHHLEEDEGVPLGSSPYYPVGSSQHDARPPAPQVDATQLSSSSRRGEKAPPSSPLPRVPPLQDRVRQAPSIPAVAPPQQHQQPQRQQRHSQPILRRPATGNRGSWMKVEAQPNLKRNGYTSHKGVAWVVQ